MAGEPNVLRLEQLNKRKLRSRVRERVVQGTWPQTTLVEGWRRDMENSPSRRKADWPCKKDSPKTHSPSCSTDNAPGMPPPHATDQPKCDLRTKQPPFQNKAEEMDDALHGGPTACPTSDYATLRDTSLSCYQTVSRQRD